MDHAVGAFLVIASAIRIPIGLAHQFVECPCVTLAEQIAGPLPAEDRACRIAPRGAMVGLVASKEVKKQTGLAERPLGLARSTLEHFAEQLLGFAAMEKVLLVGR